MLIEPTEQDKLRARKAGASAAATVTVTTTTTDRVLKPETDPDLFADAAREALTEATTAGYHTIAYVSVTEFITWPGGFAEDPIEYRYVWEFTAHRE